MNKGRSVLTRYTFDDTAVCAEYDVEHNNGSTSLEQKMILTCDNVDILSNHFNGQLWKAEIQLGEFPAQSSPTAAACKLADWLERLAGAIRLGNYTLPSRCSQFIDIDGEPEE